MAAEGPSAVLGEALAPCIEVIVAGSTGRA